MPFIRPCFRCVPLCIAFIVITIAFAEENGPADSSATAPINSHYLKMGFIPDSTTSPDTLSDAEPQIIYHPDEDRHFLYGSSKPPDFTPMKRAAPKVPDRPDILTDMPPYHRKRK